MASRIVGVSLRQIQYWDEQGFLRPSVRTAGGRGTKRIYSFSDLVRLKVIKDLTDYGLSLKTLRRCLKYLKRWSPRMTEPADSLRYVSDGEELFVLTSDRAKILDAMERQFVFSLGIGNIVRELDGEVRRIASGSRTQRGGNGGKKGPRAHG